jgi:CRP/FNR family transcriptional regulator, anaerobic regulatory protein
MLAAAAVCAPVHARSASVRSLRPTLHDVNTSCANCNLRRICMPVDIVDSDAKALFDTLVTHRVRLRKGDVLFRAGERFIGLYAIRFGSCKTVTSTDDGTEQVSGYHLQGEIMGVEGFGNDTHACTAIALEDGEVCVLPVDRIEKLAHEDASFQRRMYKLLSSAIVRERTVTLMVGTMRAEQRLASFLLDLSARYQARGYSASEFVLRVTREEIGSHLGLKLETVSRLLSRFADEGLIVVSGRVIRLLDRMALSQLVATN